jgi:acetylornithine deacetylase/succinyl-diaminopimelate desuccinylase-like protein
MEVQNILSDLIKIPSVNPPGGELEVAKYLKRLFDTAGIPNEIIESSPGRGNFIAYLGEGERRLLYLSHTDVVPATEDWDFEPFSGEIKDGFVHGRGALDCKGLVAAEAYAMLYLARNSKLNGRLIFAATADEEVDGTYGVKYLTENFGEKISADFAINEGGEGPVRINDKIACFIQVGEKGSAWTHLLAKGRACHGSIPTLGDNAVVKMAKAIADLAEYKPEVRLIPEVKTLVKALSKMKGQNLELTEENIDLLISRFENRSFAEYLRAITRMTISPNVIQGGVKTNIVPDRCQANIDIRVLPGQDKGYVIDRLSKIVGEDIEIDIPNYSVPSFSDSESPCYKLIENILKEAMGDVACLPCISSGATDSRFLRRRGIPSYGLSLMAKDFDPSLTGTMHGKNERIDIESLKVNSKFLIELAKSYLGSSCHL